MSDNAEARSRLRDSLLRAAKAANEDDAELLRLLAESPLVDTLAEGAGECVRATPPAPLHWELDNVGARMCCTHKERHCTPYIQRGG